MPTTAEVQAAAAAAMEAATVAAPNSPTLQPEDAPMDEPVDGNLPVATNGSASLAAPSMADLLQFLANQSERMNTIIEMMAHAKKNSMYYLANAKLDEKYFRTVEKFNNTKSGWKEWRRHFLNAARECDVGFADILECYEK